MSWNPCANCRNRKFKKMCSKFCTLHDKAKKINFQQQIHNGIYQQRQDHYFKRLKEVK